MAAAAAAKPTGGFTNPAAEQRRRAYAVLDAADPARGRAVRWCEWALRMYLEDGGMREARRLLRGALDCGADYPTIYRGWIALEAEHARDFPAARALFEEWRARHPAERDRDLQDEGGFWCHYIAFEARHGGAARARAVAEAAVVACPRDPAVYARYAKAELRLGHADRARDVVGRARGVFAADEDAGAREWVLDEVKRYGKSLRDGKTTLRGLLPFCGGRLSRPAQGYERLGVA